MHGRALNHYLYTANTKQMAMVSLGIIYDVISTIVRTFFYPVGTMDHLYSACWEKLNPTIK